MNKFKVGDYVVFTNKFITHYPGVEKDNIVRKITYITKINNDKYAYKLEGLPNNVFEEFELELINTRITVDNITLSSTYKPTPIKISIMPNRYVINKGATVLFWGDGTKTIVKRSENDAYDKRLGFLTAYFQKTSGMSKTKANKYLDNLVEQEVKEKKSKLNPKLKIKVSDEEIKQLDKIIATARTKYKVGDKVKIKNKDYRYKFYLSWFTENNCSELVNNFANPYEDELSEDKTYKIIAIGPHNKTDDIILAISPLHSKKIYLIGEEGVKKHNGK